MSIVGQTFNYWTVVVITSLKDKHGKILVDARCKCGYEKILPKYNVVSGKSKSCGCYVTDRVTKQNTTHNLSKHPLYARWNAIRRRCYLESDSRYMYYGAKGIRMCDEWRDNPQAFYDWYESQGGDLTLTVDRENTYGDYTPENCRLIPLAEQQKNRRPRSCYKRTP